MNRSHRDTILVEDAQVVSHDAMEGSQYILRMQAPRIALAARPGTFAYIRCDASLPLRRPMSIMRAEPEAGWIEFLYKVVGTGTRLLATQPPGTAVNVMGPIGVPFTAHQDRPVPLLLGGGVGIPPMVFLADHLRQQRYGFAPMVIMGSEVPFPFRARPSRLMVPGMPDGAIGAMPRMEEWGIPSRLASLQGFPGCFEGYVTELARHWLDALPQDRLGAVEIFACGPIPMLKAVAVLAREYTLPCQVSLEEYMACAVGGCAGCTVRVQTPEGPAMKRVCVDGPVFAAESVAWESM